MKVKKKSSDGFYSRDPKHPKQPGNYPDSPTEIVMPKNISTPLPEKRPGLPFIRKRLAESGAGLTRLARDPSLAPEILRVAACLRRALARGH